MSPYSLIEELTFCLKICFNEKGKWKLWPIKYQLIINSPLWEINCTLFTFC